MYITFTQLCTIYVLYIVLHTNILLELMYTIITSDVIFGSSQDLVIVDQILTTLRKYFYFLLLCGIKTSTRCKTIIVTNLKQLMVVTRR